MKKFGMEIVLLVGILCVPNALALTGELISPSDVYVGAESSSIAQVGTEYLHTCLTQAQESDQSEVLIDRFFAAISPELKSKHITYHLITSFPADGAGDFAFKKYEKMLDLNYWRAL